MIREEHREDLTEEELREGRSEGEHSEAHSEEERREARSEESRGEAHSEGGHREGLSEEEVRAAEEAARHSDDRRVNRRKVVKKKKTKGAAIILALTLFFLGMSGHRLEVKDATEAAYIPPTAGWEQVVKDETQVDYRLNAGVDGRISADAVIDVLRLRDYAINTSGIVVNSNSLLIGNSETLQKSEYQIMGISVVDASSGRILESADLNRGVVSEDVLNSNFGTFINNTLTKHKKSRDQVRIRICLGNRGWCDIDEYISHHCYDEAIIERARYLEGTVYDFTGDYLTLSSGATIRIKGTDGRFFSPGTRVKDSNGFEYEIVSLNVTTNSETREEWVEHPEQYIPASEGGVKVSYKVENIQWRLLPVGAAAAALTYWLQNRKKKDDDEEEETESTGGRSGDSGSERRPPEENPERRRKIRELRAYGSRHDIDPYSVPRSELPPVPMDPDVYRATIAKLYGIPDGREGFDSDREEGSARSRH